MTVPFDKVLAEGVTDAAAARRLLEQCGRWSESTIVQVAGDRREFWRLAPKHNAIARVRMVLGLTDLDRDPCAGGLIAEKLPDGRHASFVLRIAVRCLESWLLADREGFEGYFRVAVPRDAREPDGLDDPKRRLVDIVRRSRKSAIAEDMVPPPGSGHKVGPRFTNRILDFVGTAWNPARAAAVSPSLARAMAALEGS